jgi:hypothetical protein
MYSGHACQRCTPAKALALTRHRSPVRAWVRRVLHSSPAAFRYFLVIFAGQREGETMQQLPQERHPAVSRRSTMPRDFRAVRRMGRSETCRLERRSASTRRRRG